MKRKLDTNDVPAPVSDVVQTPKVAAPEVTFAGLGLDARLLQGLATQNFAKPTPVQAKAIPLAVKGRDILARAKTGSGKTAAYLLPILNAVLKRKEATNKASTTALILVPTRELADQVHRAVETFTAFCAKAVHTVNLTQKVSDAVQKALLADFPDIVITTPARAALNVNTSALTLDDVTHLVIDEADLVLSYDYGDDLKNIAKVIPKGVQTILMSATLSTDLDFLKDLFCRDPQVLEMEEQEDHENKVPQYVVKCAEDEKFLLAYVIFKLKLIQGKCIIFVGDIDRCYRLKLFLEQFGTRSCILNSELPINTRLHVVQEFNKNVYDIIIASDEHEVLGDEEGKMSVKADSKVAATDLPEDYDQIGRDATTVRAAQVSNDNDAGQPRKQKRRKVPSKDKEYGVSRGIDFQNVACVLNFDLPTSSKSYTHRIGRTGRAGQTGMALSFVVPAALYRKHKPTSIESAKDDELVLAKIVKHQGKKGKEVQPYHFDMKQVDAFRYRMNDAIRAVTKIAVREARTRELRQELMKSEKLKRHFEENPSDLHHLRHDGELRPARVQSHLKHVPEYLLPREGKRAITGDIGFVGIKKTSENRIRKARLANKAKGRGKKAAGRKLDPLKTFKSRN